MTPTADIDPGQFRLSIAASYTYGTYTGTYYLDAGYAAEVTENCYEYCDYYDPTNCMEYCYPGYTTIPVLTTALRSVSPTEMELTLTPPISANTCDVLEQWAAQGYADDAALFVHYSNNGGQIEDQAGNTVDAIAEHWVLNQSEYGYVEGSYPAMDPYLPIPCPS